MMSRYALIKYDVIENIVEWDGHGDIFDDYTTVDINNVNAGIGWEYDGEAFTPPTDIITPEQ